MAKRKPQPDASPAPSAAPDEYTVLARRYRPQQFQDIIGQEAVARALANAIECHRVAHAYLFTGARGVGKTSTARILAKALNCEQGPTITPCDRCDRCRSIATGEDLDVLEIDGASNRGIDEIREIRQTVQSRPARGRYKIYIIDEVHMLTAPAFNALLKTLEEPPSHVKFIFATTEVQRIPVTILSRCQRFDFGSISTERIVEHLQEIVTREGRTADREALEFLARRAGGSMRDAQSLLDQLLAFGSGPDQAHLTTEQVHRLLGTAHDERIAQLAEVLLNRDARQALDLLEAASDEGLQLGELIDQLIDYWRDLMVVNCAGPEARVLSVSNQHRPALVAQATRIPLDTILAGLDVLTTTKSRLRNSAHGRVLVEMALVRLSRLEDLVSISQLAQLVSGAPSNLPARPRSAPAAPAASPAAKPAVIDTRRTRTDAEPVVEVEKKNPSNGSGAAAPKGPVALTAETLDLVWPEVLHLLGPILAGNVEKAGVAITGPKNLVLRFPTQYNLQHEHSQSRAARIEEALRKVTGHAWSVRTESVGNDAAAPPVPAVAADQSLSRHRRQRTEVMKEPLVKRASDILGAQIVQVDDEFGSAPRDAADTEETESEEK